MKYVKYNELTSTQMRNLEKDPSEKEWSGVLLSDKIKYYCKHCNLINPPDVDCSKINCLDGEKCPIDDQFQPASYDLRLGTQYYLKGHIYTLDESNPLLTIPKNEVIIIETLEELTIPRYIIGRWNLRIGLVYKGILLVAGPQVDPGYRGKLYCTLYNMSQQDVSLSLGDHVATIDFIKTSIYYEDKCKKFEGKRGVPYEEKKTLKDYVIASNNIRSAPIEIYDEVKEIRGKYESFLYAVLTVMSILTGLIIFVFIMLLAKL